MKTTPKEKVIIDAGRSGVIRECRRMIDKLDKAVEDDPSFILAMQVKDERGHDGLAVAGAISDAFTHELVHALLRRLDPETRMHMIMNIVLGDKG